MIHLPRIFFIHTASPLVRFYNSNVSFPILSKYVAERARANDSFPLRTTPDNKIIMPPSLPLHQRMPYSTKFLCLVFCPPLAVLKNRRHIPHLISLPCLTIYCAIQSHVMTGRGIRRKGGFWRHELYLKFSNISKKTIFPLPAVYIHNLAL